MKNLQTKWELVFETLGKDENLWWSNEEGHYESICVGFCLAKGLSLEQALEFYETQVKSGENF